MISKAEIRFTAFVTYVLQKNVNLNMAILCKILDLKEQNFLQQN